MAIVRANFDPLCPGTSGIIEFLHQACSPKMKATNPKCIVTHKICHDKTPSYLAVNYENDNVEYFQLTHNKNVDEIFYDLALQTGMLEQKYKWDKNEAETDEDDLDFGKKK